MAKSVEEGAIHWASVLTAIQGLLCLSLTSFQLESVAGVKSSVCRPKCGRFEYEYIPCFESLDRRCKDMLTLPKPLLSPNLIYEDRRDVKQVVSHVIPQGDSTVNHVTSTVHLKRGSGFSVQVTLKELNLSPLFRPVDHSNSNDNEAFQGDSKILSDFCPHPLPDKYQLSLVLHQGVTTKARPSMPCNRSDSGGHVTGNGATNGRCLDGDSSSGGYSLSPRESCQTYSVFGRLPSLNTGNRSIVCTRPGPLTDRFGVSRDLKDPVLLSVDKSAKCFEQRARCDACSVACAHHMQAYQGSHRCNITADDADDGLSPRLQLCFTCCSIQDCSKACQVYQTQECRRVRCATGNVAEFVLTPIFPPSESGLFGCRVEQVKGYKVYDVEYSVIHRGDVVGDVRLSATRSQNGGLAHRQTDEHKFLLIHFGSEVTEAPDQLEGNVATGKITAGYYQATGNTISSTEVLSKVVYMRPKRPFAIALTQWRKKNCDTDLMSEFDILTDSLSRSDAFRPNPDIEVEPLAHFTYRLSNRTQSRPPFIYFEIPSDQSILRPLFPLTTIADDKDLRAGLIRREHEWVLHVEGRLLTCPGTFELVVTDPSYPGHPLFHLDFGVNCPERFSVNCSIPTEGPDIYDKTLRIDLIDSYRTIKVTVFRQSPNISITTTYTGYSPSNPKEGSRSDGIAMTVFSPIIALICVIIAMLTFLLLVGVITETGGSSKSVQRKEAMLHSRRLLFVVCYVTFRATYSIVATFTVLVLLIRHVNRDSMSVLGDFSSFVRSVEANQTHLLESIQSFVADEILRQNTLANETKNTCELKLNHLQNLLEQTKQQMRGETKSDERLVSQVALQYTKLMIVNLTNNVNRFKQDFSRYANNSLDRLLKSMKETMTSIERNKWLAGAKVIYDVVRSKRSAQGKETKLFADWAGIRYDVDNLTLDLSLKDFPMPNISDFLNLELPKLTESVQPLAAEEVVLPRNQWYYQYERKPVSSSVWSTRSRVDKDPKVMVSEVIGWTTLMTIIVAIDAVWFIHRMARTYSTAKTLLYGGQPKYRDCHHVEDVQVQRVSASSSQSTKCLKFIKDLNFRVMRTDFVPKAVAAVTVCCGVYVLLMVFDRLLSIRTMSSIGYFDALMAPVETSYQMAVTRIRTNAYRIRKFEFPFYEELVNLRTKRYQLMADMYAEIQRSTTILHSSELCSWKKRFAPMDQCHCPKVTAAELKFDGCQLQPIRPQIINRHDFSTFRHLLSQSIGPYIDAGRHLVTDSCHLVVTFLGIVVVTDLLDAVMWLYLKRLNILRPKTVLDFDRFPEFETGLT